MQQQYPDQKPSFLFDTIERATHTAIRTEAFYILQAERDALRIRLNELQTSHQSIREQHVAVVTERDYLLQVVGDDTPLSERSQWGYECVLGAMLQVIFGRSPAGQRYSIFDSQESFVNTMVTHGGELLSVSKRSLDTKFAAAQRRLETTRRLQLQRCNCHRDDNQITLPLTAPTWL